MTKKLLSIPVLITILSITALSLTACQQNPSSTVETPIENSNTDQSPSENSEKVTFVITGENYKFIMDGQENPDMKVKAGTMVRVDFQSTEGFHDWVVDEFSAATQQVQAPDSTYVEFVADQPGEYEYYCSVGQHREQGMYGKFIVE